MKHIDAEQLRTELKMLRRRYGYNELWDLSCYQAELGLARVGLIDEILSLLNTLEETSDNWKPSEEQMEALNEEVKRYYSDNFAYISSDQPTLSILTNIARHFAEWQREQMMDEWLKDRDGCFWDGVEEGKKAMKEQMLKEAVEGEIRMRYSGCLCATTIRAINEDKFKLGEKVRIIIVREKEK